jgi:cell division protein FtsZ
MGYAVMGTATASGARRAMEAAQRAIASPLLEAGAIDGARGILINITGSTSLKLSEVNEASMIIQSAAHEDANIIFGAVLDEKMKDAVKITVIATGFKTDAPQRRGHGISSASAAISRERVTSTYTIPEPVQEYRDEVVAAPAPPPRVEVPKTVIPTFEHDDLDVPTFLRKPVN